MLIKKTKKIIFIKSCNVKKHDFRVFKESKTLINSNIKLITDRGYQDIRKIHENSELPKKKTKKRPLSDENIKNNKEMILVKEF